MSATDIGAAPCMACICARLVTQEEPCPCPDCPCVISAYRDQVAELAEYRSLGTPEEIRQRIAGCHQATSLPGGLCVGLATSETDDEPPGVCKNCPK